MLRTGADGLRRGGDLNAAPRFGRIGEGLVAPADGGERFETLLAAGGRRVERIVSHGQSDPPGQWYDQPGGEFMLLLAGAARLGFADDGERTLAPGDWAVLPGGCRHRIAWTDQARETR